MKGGELMSTVSRMLFCDAHEGQREDEGEERAVANPHVGFEVAEHDRRDWK